MNKQTHLQCFRLKSVCLSQQSKFHYDFFYVLINKGINCKELRGYSLNGICFGKYKEHLSNFQLTKEVKILVDFIDKAKINILHPITCSY